MTDQHPWVRQPSETAPSYEYFKIYMHMGTQRGLRQVAEEVGKSRTHIENLSAKYKWTERVTAYDSFITKAEIDGFADQTASVRSKHMRITDKLLDHLEGNLDKLAPGQDPSIRWTQAYAAACKVHVQALDLREDKVAGNGTVDKILRLMEKAEQE